MGNGLFLPVEEFNQLPNKAKLTCLYENQVRQIELASVQRKESSKIRVNQKVQYGWLGAITAGIVFTFKFFAGRL